MKLKMNRKTVGILFMLGSICLFTVTVPWAKSWDTLFSDTNTTEIQHQEERQPGKNAAPPRSFQTWKSKVTFLDRARAKGLDIMVDS